MGYIDRDALLARRLETSTGFPEADVEVPGIGTVRVRGLSRFEVLHIQQTKGGPAAVEVVTVHLGLVEPKLSEDEVKKWQRVSVASELEPITEAIGRLSGMFEKADKRAYQDFEADPGSEFRLLPSGEAVDDGSQAEDGTN